MFQIQREREREIKQYTNMKIKAKQHEDDILDKIINNSIVVHQITDKNVRREIKCINIDSVIHIVYTRSQLISKHHDIQYP
jgi:hypothetical protein